MFIDKKRQGSCGGWLSQSSFHDEVLRKLYGKGYDINMWVYEYMYVHIYYTNAYIYIYIYIYIFGAYVVYVVRTPT